MMRHELLSLILLGHGLRTVPLGPTAGLLLPASAGDLRSGRVAWSGDHATTEGSALLGHGLRTVPLGPTAGLPLPVGRGDLRSGWVAWSGDHATTDAPSLARRAQSGETNVEGLKAAHHRFPAVPFP